MRSKTVILVVTYCKPKLLKSMFTQLRNVLMIVTGWSVCFISCQSNSLLNQKLRTSQPTSGISTLSFDYVNHLIRLEAGLNTSSESHDFILDSGAPTFITDTLVKVHNLIQGDAETATDVNGHQLDINRYKVNSLQLGDYKLGNLDVWSSEKIKEMPVLRHYEGEGLIGADVMKHLIWKIDYGCRQITLTRSIDSLHLPAGTRFTIMRMNSDGNPVIRANIGGKKSRDFIVDLGYNGSVLLPAHILKRELIEESVSYNSNQSVATGFHSNSGPVKNAWLKQFKSGSLQFEHIKAITAGNNTKALVGNAFFENHILILDFINQRLFLLDPPKNCA